MRDFNRWSMMLSVVLMSWKNFCYCQRYPKLSRWEGSYSTHRDTAATHLFASLVKRTGGQAFNFDCTAEQGDYRLSSIREIEASHDPHLRVRSARSAYTERGFINVFIQSRKRFSGLFYYGAHQPMRLPHLSFLKSTLTVGSAKTLTSNIKFLGRPLTESSNLML